MGLSGSPSQLDLTLDLRVTAQPSLVTCLDLPMASSLTSTTVDRPLEVKLMLFLPSVRNHCMLPSGRLVACSHHKAHCLSSTENASIETPCCLLSSHRIVSVSLNMILLAQQWCARGVRSSCEEQALLSSLSRIAKRLHGFRHLPSVDVSILCQKREPFCLLPLQKHVHMIASFQNVTQGLLLTRWLFSAEEPTVPFHADHAVLFAGMLQVPCRANNTQQWEGLYYPVRLLTHSHDVRLNVHICMTFKSIRHSMLLASV